MIKSNDDNNKRNYNGIIGTCVLNKYYFICMQLHSLLLPLFPCCYIAFLLKYSFVKSE